MRNFFLNKMSKLCLSESVTMQTGVGLGLGERKYRLVSTSNRSLWKVPTVHRNKCVCACVCVCMCVCVCACVRTCVRACMCVCKQGVHTAHCSQFTVN